MSLTQQDLDDAVLAGKNRFAEWQREFDQNWNAPMTEAQIGMFWRSVPEEMKTQLMLRDPQAVKEMDRLYGGG